MNAVPFVTGSGCLLKLITILTSLVNKKIKLALLLLELTFDSPCLSEIINQGRFIIQGQQNGQST